MTKEQKKRRERIATAVLAAIVCAEDWDGWFDEWSVHAVEAANALIAELDKEPTDD